MTVTALIDYGQVAKAPIRAGRRQVFFISWVLLAVLSIVWSIATPLAAAPDEPAHIVKAASVVRGQFIGVASSLGHVVEVPRYVDSMQAITCFAFHPDITPDCAPAQTGNPAELVQSTTTAGLYNPVYYLLVGWPTLIFDDALGIYAMRVISGVLSSFFLALTFVIAFGWQRNTVPLLAVATAIPPMLIFLGAAVNPNGAETTATLATFAAMLAVVLQPDDRLLTQRSLVVFAGSAIAINTRGLSALWIAIAILTPLMLLGGTRLRDLLSKRAVHGAVAGTAAATVFAVGWLLGTNSLGAAIGDEDTFQVFPGVGATPLSGFLNTIAEMFGYAQGMIGNFGWLDTPAPLSVHFIWSAFVGALLIAAFTFLRGRALALAVVLTALFVVLPAVIQGAYVTGGGIIWQGRYALPLFAMLAFGLGVLMAEHSGGLPRPALDRLGFIVWLGWAAAQYFSFATTLRRYAVGTSGTWKDTLLSPAWSAPGGNAAALAASAVIIGLLSWWGWRLGCRSIGTLSSRENVIALPRPV
jgi:hypothetical protein